MGRISIPRFASFALPSRQQPLITCTTFNILAPIYKRIDQKVIYFFYTCIYDLFSLCDELILFQKKNVFVIYSLSFSLFVGCELPRK